MNRRGGLLVLILALAVLQITSRSHLGTLFAKPVLDASDYAAFSSELNSLILLFGLGTLAVMLHFRRGGERENGGAAPARAWWVAFLLVVGLPAALTLRVNPDGRLPWNHRTRYISFPTRVTKLDMYEKLQRTPELINMGSSVSFTMPAEYLGQKWDLDAFNMSVSGGSTSDFLDLLNFVRWNSPDQHLPSVVIIELLWGDLRPASDAQIPMRMVPYTDPLRGTAAVLDMMDFTLRSDSLLDSLFTVLFVDSGRWQNYLDFTSNGTAVRLLGLPSASGYLRIMRHGIAFQKELMSCERPDPAGLRYIERIVKLSEQQHFAVVFYTPPVNADFYSIGEVKPQRFAACRKLVDEYMEQLADSHSNVFFSDLVNYQPISSLGRQVYLDPHHLTREGNIMVLQALEPEIKQALRWARENR